MSAGLIFYDKVSTVNIHKALIQASISSHGYWPFKVVTSASTLHPPLQDKGIKQSRACIVTLAANSITVAITSTCWTCNRDNPLLSAVPVFS